VDSVQLDLSSLRSVEECYERCSGGDPEGFGGIMVHTNTGRAASLFLCMIPNSARNQAHGVADLLRSIACEWGANAELLPPSLCSLKQCGNVEFDVVLCNAGVMATPKMQVGSLVSSLWCSLVAVHPLPPSNS